MGLGNAFEGAKRGIDFQIGWVYNGARDTRLGVNRGR